MSSKDRVSNNLIALGAAVVLTVYTAGYARTEPAARRLDDDVNERRPPTPPSPVTLPVGEVTLPPSTPAPRVEVPKLSANVAVKPQAPTAAPQQRQSTPADSAPSTRVPQPAAPAVATTLPVAPPPVTPPPADTATKPAEKDSVVAYKDGVYFGWGTSRHGDIQMGIEIKGGRIASAFISECYTQYSCSWVNHLQKQVVERQSADVDFVSGATQSANALYRAVVNALKQAK